MTERIEQELALLRSVYPNLEWRGDALWVRIPEFAVPPGSWKQAVVEVAFRMPPGLPGEAPYAFFVRPGLEPVSPSTIENYLYPVSSPCFGDDWGQLSWAPEAWAPHAEITRGSNMLNFARSFADRLREGP
jgi:hypothetical protein